MSIAALRRTSVRTALALALTAGAAGAQWSVETLSQARTNTSAVAAGDRVFFAGGNQLVSTQPIVFNFLDVIDVYDATVGPPDDPAAWSVEKLSLARTDIASTVVGEHVLFAGGARSLSSATPRVDVLDTTTMTWSQASLSGALRGCAPATLGDLALFAGGNTEGLGGLAPTDLVEVYDGALGPPSMAGAWSTVSLSEARSSAAAAVVGGKLLVAGGTVGPGPTVTDTVDIYDSSVGPPSDPAAWSTAQLSQARLIGRRGSAVAGDKAYFAGGTLPGGVPSDVVDIYDAATDTWSVTTLATARQGSSVVAVGDTVIFAGGSGPGGVTDSVETLDATTGTWGPSARIERARQAMGAATLGERAFFGGGFVSGGSADELDVFDAQAWTNLGGGSEGFDGVPFLTGAGSLVGGTPASVTLSHAPAGVQMLAWVSFGPTPFAAIGGTVHAFPYSTQLFLVADATGGFVGATTWPEGTQVWFQFVIEDVTSLYGLTLSNGVRATTP